MNPSVLVLALLSALAVLAVSWWIRSRNRALREPEGEATLRFSAARFDTTMGELRDMREALRPAAHPQLKSSTQHANKG